MKVIMKLKELTRYCIYVLFSLKGRISRRWFWFWFVSSAAFLIAVAGLNLLLDPLRLWLYRYIVPIQHIDTITFIMFGPIFLYVLYTAFAVGIKRLADTNRKGWEVILVLIPIIDFFCFGVGFEQLSLGLPFYPILRIYPSFILSIGVVGTVILYFLSPFCTVYISIVCGFLTVESPTETDQRNWGKFFKRLLLVISIIAFCAGFLISGILGSAYPIGFGFWSVWLVWGYMG